MPMSQILSLRIPDQLAERLDRFARRLGNGATRTRVGLMLLEESLREAEFAHIEYRDSAAGRQPCMKDSGLAVWEVIMVAKDHELNVEQTAQYFRRSHEWVLAALNYYAAYREEIDQAIADNHVGFETMRQLLPGMRVFETPAS